MRVTSSNSLPPSSPASTIETQVLRHKLALLRGENHELASELNSLRSQSAALPSSSDEEENITDREVRTPIESHVVALETQSSANEAQLADVPKIIHVTIARQMESVIAQVTQAITHIIPK